MRRPGPFAKAVIRALIKTGVPISDERFWSTWVPGGSYGAGSQVGTADMTKAIGDGKAMDVLMIPVLWIARRMMESPLGVVSKDEPEVDLRHRAARLMASPNPWYSGGTMIMAASIDFCVDGNGYLRKYRGERDEVVGLSYLPSWTIEPEYAGVTYTERYRYNPSGLMSGRDGETRYLRARDVVHWRYGIDPNNTRKGLAPLKILLRRIYTDVQAAQITAMLIKNAGLFGAVISPETGASIHRPDDTKKYIEEGFEGTKTGKVLVMTAPTRVSYFGVDAQKMDLSALMDVGEERVCALLSVPSAVVGFGTGMQQTKVGATLQELRLMAYEDCILPTQVQLCSELDLQLLPDFEGAGSDYHFQHDNSKVKVLQDDENKKSDRWTKVLTSGGCTLEKFHQALDMDSDPSEAVYYLPGMAQVVSARSLARMGAEAEKPKVPAQPAPESAPPAGGTQPPAEKREPVAVKAKATMSPALARLTRALLREQRSLRRGWEPRLASSLDELGQGISERAMAIAQGRRGKRRKDWLENLSVADWMLIGEEALQDAWVDGLLKILQGSYREHYLAVARATFAKIEAELGVGVMLDDFAQQAIYQVAGRRLGLLDVQGEAKDSLFEAIAEAREAGLGAGQMATLIRDQIAAGPWTTSQVRAQVIARTETAYAQNYSSLQAYREAGYSKILIFDAQLGPTDAECEALDQTEVSLEEAMRLMEAEHPNGTRNFAPVIGDENG